MTSFCFNLSYESYKQLPYFTYLLFLKHGSRFLVVGDCYVAATGIPTPSDDHAVVMASFARRCLDKMLSLVVDLEISLGPGTAELGLRFGLHSGPTIGGVLRGTKARYQLYGDTMNTAGKNFH